MKLAALALAAVALTGAPPPCHGGQNMPADTAAIEEVKQRHAASLMARPGVVSVGVGLDVRGRPAIIVGVESEEAAAAAALPQTLEGFPVDVQVMGPVRAQ